MEFSDPPRIISPSAANTDMDEFMFTGKNEFGLHSVSILVPRLRTAADERHARFRAEEAATKSIAESRSAVCLSLGWG